MSKYILRRGNSSELININFFESRLWIVPGFTGMTVRVLRCWYVVKRVLFHSAHLYISSCVPAKLKCTRGSVWLGGDFEAALDLGAVSYAIRFRV